MQLQTFHVTNSVPQRQNKFNGSIWNALENAIQAEAADEEIYIVTGVTFNKPGESKTVEYISPKDDSSQKCAIPNYFYKVVLKVQKSGSTVVSASTIGFWFEHKDYDNTSYSNYAVSVDQMRSGQALISLSTCRMKWKRQLRRIQAGLLSRISRIGQ